MHTNEEYVVQALKAGAAGYLLKDSAPNELEIAVNSVMKGETYLSPAISKHVVDNYLRRISDVSTEKERGPDIFKQLTSRQREILQLIAEGNSKELKSKYLTNTILEIECIPVVDALSILEKAPFVDETTIFGNQIHVIVNEKYSEKEQIKSLLETKNISVKSIENIVPSLEDVFIHLLEKK